MTETYKKMCDCEEVLNDFLEYIDDICGCRLKQSLFYKNGELKEIVYPDISTIQKVLSDRLYDCYFGLYFEEENKAHLEVQYFDNRLNTETEREFTGSLNEVWLRCYMLIKHYMVWDIKGEKWIRNE